MRVLLISHTCQSRTEGQPRAEQIGRIPGIELLLLTPDRWLHYGQWRAPQIPQSASFSCRVGKVAWPWVGAAQCYLHWYPRLDEVLREFQPDIIDLWEENWGLVSVRACWLRKRLLPNAKIVAETEQNVSKKLPPPFEQFRAYTLRHADFVVARNQEAIGLVQIKGYRGPSEVIPNAVDAELFRPMDKEACRAALGLSGFVIGYVGRIVEEKGLMDIVEALPLCSDDVKLLFVGSGPYQPELERRIGELGKSAQVQFMSSQPLEELPRVMNALDLFVLMSRTTRRWKEQFGRVIIEAHSCGTPVLGSDSGAIPDVIGQGGLVVPERDSAALAAAIMQLKANTSERVQMGLVGRKQVEAQYTWQRVAQRMNGIYTNLLKK